MNEKQKKWVHTRHRAVFAFLRPIMRVYTRLVYGYRARKAKLDRRQPYLVLSNHQTGFDQFLIALSFRRPLYYIASDDLFNRRISGLIEYLVAPIPKSKSSRDLETIRNCYRIAKEGGTICVFPEGNRTFSGQTETIDRSITKLVRLLQLPVVFYRFEGGYGVQPRWAKSVRRGRMTGGVTGVVSPEEWGAWSEDRLYEEICRRLFRDENDTEQTYRSRRLAEYQERAFYYCPDCGKMNWVSEQDLMICRDCGRTVRYTGHNRYEIVKGRPVCTTPKEWYDAQLEWCRQFDFGAAGEAPIFGGETVTLWESVRCRRKIFLERGVFRFFADRMEIGAEKVPLSEISDMTVLGKNKVNFYRGGKIYQIEPPKRFCAVRLVEFFYSYQRFKGVRTDGFMGL